MGQKDDTALKTVIADEVKNIINAAPALFRIDGDATETTTTPPPPPNGMPHDAPNGTDTPGQQESTAQNPNPNPFSPPRDAPGNNNTTTNPPPWFSPLRPRQQQQPPPSGQEQQQQQQQRGEPAPAPEPNDWTHVSARVLGVVSKNFFLQLGNIAAKSVAELAYTSLAKPLAEDATREQKLARRRRLMLVSSLVEFAYYEGLINTLLLPGDWGTTAWNVGRLGLQLATIGADYVYHKEIDGYYVRAGISPSRKHDTKLNMLIAVQTAVDQLPALQAARGLGSLAGLSTREHALFASMCGLAAVGAATLAVRHVSLARERDGTILRHGERFALHQSMPDAGLNHLMHEAFVGAALVGGSIAFLDGASPYDTLFRAMAFILVRYCTARPPRQRTQRAAYEWARALLIGALSAGGFALVHVLQEKR